jgi:hypothetical protein
MEGLSALYDNLIPVDEDESMTIEQIEQYKKYIPEQLWKEDMNWTWALAYTKDITAPLLDGFFYIVDYASFIPAWRNRWRYCINLDEKVLQISKGGLEVIGHGEEILSKNVDYMKRIAPFVLGRFPLGAIPDDWLEQCQARWHGKFMLKVVEWDEEAFLAVEHENDFEEQHKFSKMKFHIG